VAKVIAPRQRRSRDFTDKKLGVQDIKRAERSVKGKSNRATLKVAKPASGRQPLTLGGPSPALDKKFKALEMLDALDRLNAARKQGPWLG